MKIVTLIARILLGLAFLFFGLNGFLNFIPQQPMPDGLAKQFIEALIASHYVLFVSGIEVVSGILFVINRYVPLGLTLHGPVIVNILLFHAFMSPSLILPGLLVTVFWFIVFWSVRSAFAGIFQQKVEG
jgi:putative oxidoreductase